MNLYQLQLNKLLNKRNKNTHTFSELIYRIANELPLECHEEHPLAQKILSEIKLYNHLINEFSEGE